MRAIRKTQRKVVIATWRSIRRVKRLPLRWNIAAYGIITLKQKAFAKIIRKARMFVLYPTRRWQRWAPVAWERVYRHVIPPIVCRNVNRMNVVSAWENPRLLKVIRVTRVTRSPLTKTLLVSSFVLTWRFILKYMMKLVSLGSISCLLNKRDTL